MTITIHKDFKFCIINDLLFARLYWFDRRCFLSNTVFHELINVNVLNVYKVRRFSSSEFCFFFFPFLDEIRSNKNDPKGFYCYIISDYIYIVIFLKFSAALVKMVPPHFCRMGPLDFRNTHPGPRFHCYMFRRTARNDEVKTNVDYIW